MSESESLYASIYAVCVTSKNKTSRLKFSARVPKQETREGHDIGSLLQSLALSRASSWPSSSHSSPYRARRAHSSLFSARIACRDNKACFSSSRVSARALACSSSSSPALTAIPDHDSENKIGQRAATPQSQPRKTTPPTDLVPTSRGATAAARRAVTRAPFRARAARPRGRTW